MRVLFSYTLNTIRRSRNTSLSIMAAVLLASTLLCAICNFGYTQLKWRVEVEEYQDGSWHGELGGEILPSGLEVVESNLYVEKTMAKGPFAYLKLPEGSPLPYLLLRGADGNYWDSMGEKNLVTEGRVPQKPGEVVVSKSFFEQNPAYGIGDTIRLPQGERRLGEEILHEGNVWREGEQFCQTGEALVTLVGKLDVTAGTASQGYYAMGYLDRDALTEDQELVVYVKFKDIRKTYELMPVLAEAIGIEKDEYGKYDNHFRYHTLLLMENFVFPPEKGGSIQDWAPVLVYIVLLLLAAGAFVMIIHGAFQVSASARMKQLGMFRSVGATPMQIGGSILMEGFLLSVLPVMLSVGIGYLFTCVVMDIYSDIAGDMLYFPVTVYFSPWIALFSVGVSFLTVLVAALIPALKAAGMSPIEAIRGQGERVNWKKKRKKAPASPVSRRLFGYVGELAGVTHYASRRGFRASVLSLTLCLALLVGFFTLMRLNDFLGWRNKNASYYNIYCRMNLTEEADRELLEKVLAVPGEEEGVYYSVARMAYWASPEQETSEFQERGGFGGLDLKKWGLVEREGKYRIRAYLFGLQEEWFDQYCRLCGEDPEKYYDKSRIRALAAGMAPAYPDVVNHVEKSRISYPHLALSVGEELLIEEKTGDYMDTDYAFPIEVGALAEKEPLLDDVRNNYTLNFYMPLSVYYAVMEKLSPDQGGYNTYIKIKTSPEEDLAVTEKIEEICRSQIAEEDLVLYSDAREEQENAVSMAAMEAVVDCIGFLLGLIGVANTLSAVSHTMLRRRREFAMLRSVGMDSQGVGKLLLLEGIRMALTPVLAALPAVFLLLGILMGVLDVAWGDLLPFLPWGKIAGSLGAVMAAVAVSYLAAAGKIKKDTIIEAVRDENLG